MLKESENVYVADQNNHRVQKFDATGAFLTKWGAKGTGNGQFQKPYGIAVDTNGHVYVTEKGVGNLCSLSLDSRRLPGA